LAEDPLGSLTEQQRRIVLGALSQGLSKGSAALAFLVGIQQAHKLSE
jgi:hypothetical protein